MKVVMWVLAFLTVGFAAGWLWMTAVRAPVADHQPGISMPGAVPATAPATTAVPPSPSPSPTASPTTRPANVEPSAGAGATTGRSGSRDTAERDRPAREQPPRAGTERREPTSPRATARDSRTTVVVPPPVRPGPAAAVDRRGDVRADDGDDDDRDDDGDDDDRDDD